MKAFEIALLSAVLSVFGAVGIAGQTGFHSDTGTQVKIPSIHISPKHPGTGDKVKLIVKIEDGFVRADAVWFVNGQIAQEDSFSDMVQESELERDIKVGDKIEVRVNVLNVNSGKTLKEHVQSVEVVNGPPHLELIDQQVEGDMYTAEIKAEDPDGDKFTLKLKKAPQGMTIDQNGKIEWKVNRNLKGKFRIIVAAEDEKGKVSELSFGFKLRWSK